MTHEPLPHLIAAELDAPVQHATELATRLGLDPYPVNFWIVDYDEMNQLIAYEGFQKRYPHWRWGMQYDQRSKMDRFHAGKAFEIVNNDNPASAFLQESNTLADQKAVITHVMAHADFFKQNEWFETIDPEDPGAAAMMASHADRIHSFMDDPDRDREEVERWIDHILCLTDTIDQHGGMSDARTETPSESDDRSDQRALADRLSDLGVRDEVRDAVFEDRWTEEGPEPPEVDTPQADVLAYLRDHGKQFDEETGRATEMEDWQREVIDILRAEAYYFAPQRMTKVMNEGWSAYWESVMMADEGFANPDEILDYADHLAEVLASPGLNPYALGKYLWEYVENTVNRREVLEQLLRVDGITWRTLPRIVDFDDVLAALDPPEPLERVGSNTVDDLRTVDPVYVDESALERAIDGNIDVDRYPWKVLTYEGLARRNYSLTKPRFRGFLARVEDAELERLDRYLTDGDRYDDIEDALSAVTFTAGWDRMREIRRSHNDITFLDAFLTREFIEDRSYFAYEFDHASGQFRVSSTDYDAVRQKLLLQFTNFGKPRISVQDGNYENRNELLLGHHYNGISLDIAAARDTLERIFQLWGRPVNLHTVVKTVEGEDLAALESGDRRINPEERAISIRYDGETFDMKPLAWEDVESFVDTELGYDTTPDDW